MSQGNRLSINIVMHETKSSTTHMSHKIQTPGHQTFSSQLSTTSFDRQVGSSEARHSTSRSPRYVSCDFLCAPRSACRENVEAWYLPLSHCVQHTHQLSALVGVTAFMQSFKRDKTVGNPGSSVARRSA